MTSSLVPGARFAAARITCIVAPAVAQISSAPGRTLRALLALTFALVAAACGGGGGDSDADEGSPGGGGSGTIVRLPATGFTDLVGRIRQNYPGAVPEAVLQDVLTYTAGEEMFQPENGYFWWTRSAKRFNVRFLRVDGGRQVNLDYTSTVPLVG